MTRLLLHLDRTSKTRLNFMTPQSYVGLIVTMGKQRRRFFLGRRGTHYPHEVPTLPLRP
nr:MAG TPA: hypothetical protein [Caudoviricetes sp.]